MPDFEYEIGGKVYFQQELVWAQIRQLAKVLNDFKFTEGEGLTALLNSQGDKLPRAFAVVLIEKGTLPEEKDLEALTAIFENTLTATVITRVVNDFLACNPVDLILQNLTGTVRTTFLKMLNLKLMMLSGVSRKETSSEETESSGDTPPESAEIT